MAGLITDMSNQATQSVSAPLRGGPRESHRLARAPIDVWTRWGSKYRTRALVLLAVNVMLFMAMGCFAYWMRTGVAFAPLDDDYLGKLVQTFGVRSGDRNITLGMMLLDPISVQEVPWQIPILGLLLAALIAIPVLVALLYGLWSALPFILIVGFFAMMPWLSITLVISCIIATVKPFRSSFRFVSALLSLIPATIYLLLASAGGNESLGEMLDPIERAKFIAPWVLAVVAAAVTFAIVLTLAKMVNYRPGVITPLLAMMLVLPILLFEAKVGRDELYYRLHADRTAVEFEDVDTTLTQREALDVAYRNHPLPKPSYEALREQLEQKWAWHIAPGLEQSQRALQMQREAVVERWSGFIENFPSSRYALNAHYQRARAQDIRVDQTELQRTNWIRYYDDFPTEASLPDWQKILANQPPPNLAAIARLRVAQLDARAGHVEEAVERLETLIAGHNLISADTPEEAPAPSEPAHILDRKPAHESLNIPIERVLLQAHRLHDLLVENDDPIRGYGPLTGSLFERDVKLGLLDHDPRDPGYALMVQDIKDHYLGRNPTHLFELADNLDLEIAKATANLDEKIDRLDALLEKWPDGDAAPEARYRLGLAYRARDEPQAGRDVLQQLLTKDPNSIWTREALKIMQAPSPTRIADGGKP